MPKTLISNLHGREILDSRGNPTVEAEITLADNVRALAAVPSGASVGRREAVEKRDNDTRYNGKGVRLAVAHINNDIAPALLGLDAADQQGIDKLLTELDGSVDKSNFGANALLAVSLAVRQSAALAANKPLYSAIGGNSATRLPVPLMNLINGGAHAGNNLDIQEFMLVPHGFDDFGEALRAGVETFHALHAELCDAGLSTAVGDEGGFAPNLNGVEQTFQLLLKAVERAGYRPGEQFGIALDCAAGEFYNDGIYTLKSDGFAGDAAAFVDLLESWTERYPIISIEDGCEESDWDGWKLLTQRLGGRVQLVGDDLFVTNPAILKHGIRENMATALLVKPNQIGTLSEMIQAVELAQQAGYATIMSHRSGDTEYSTIADIAVGLGCPQIKAGAPCRGERTAKYNQLLRIADALGNRAHYAEFSAAAVAA